MRNMKTPFCVGFPNPEGISLVSSEVYIRVNLGLCGHVAATLAATWCYINMYTNLLAELVYVNQAAPPNYICPPLHVAIKVGFQGPRHHQS